MAYERSVYEATMDIDYAVCLAQRHERFYGRVKKGIVLLNLLAGSAAIATLISPNSVLLVIAAVVVATTSAMDVVYDFGAMSSAHAADRRRFLKLRSRVGTLPLPKIDAAFANASIDAAPAIESLRLPVHNANLRQHGRSEFAVPLSLLQKIMGAIA